MITSLAQKVTLAAMAFLVLIAVVATLAILNTLALRDAAAHLTDDIIPQVDGNGDFNTAVSQTLGELETFMRGAEAEDLAEAQEAMREAEDALVRLGTQLTGETYFDPDARLADQRILEQRAVVLDTLQQLVSTASSQTAGPEIVAQIDALQADLQQLEADSDTNLERNGMAAATLLTTHVQYGFLGAGALGFICVVLTLLTLFLLRRYIAQPVTELSDMAYQVTAGRSVQPVRITSKNEIGALQQAFNTMVATLQQQTQQLQLQVEAAQAAQVAAEAARAEVTAQLQTIEKQRSIIREMSVPILPLSDKSLMMPLIGALDTTRLQLVQQQTLHAIERTGARYALLDITGVPVIDTLVADGLLRVVRAARLLGAEVVLVGIRPEVAQTVVELGTQLGQIVVRSTLQEGIRYVLE